MPSASWRGTTRCSVQIIVPSRPLHAQLHRLDLGAHRPRPSSRTRSTSSSWVILTNEAGVVVELLRRVAEHRLDRGIHVLEERHGPTRTRYTTSAAISASNRNRSSDSRNACRRVPFLGDLGERADRRPTIDSSSVAHRRRRHRRPDHAPIATDPHTHHEVAQHLAGAQRARRRDVASRRAARHSASIRSSGTREEASLVTASPIAAKSRSGARVRPEHAAVAVEGDDRELERVEELVLREVQRIASATSGVVDHDELVEMRQRRSAGSRARTRVPPSACTSTSTSPSRWSAATTSPRSYGTNSSTIGARARRRAPTVSRSTVDALARDGGHHDGVGMRAEQRLHVAGRRGVGLVEDEQLGHVSGADLAQHRADGVDLLLGVGGTGVDDVHQQFARRRPPRGSTGTTRPAGGAGAARTRRCRRRSTVSPPGSRRRRVVGSRVENRRSSTSTSASVIRFSRVDFPALV